MLSLLILFLLVLALNVLPTPTSTGCIVLFAITVPFNSIGSPAATQLSAPALNLALTRSTVTCIPSTTPERCSLRSTLTIAEVPIVNIACSLISP